MKHDIVPSWSLSSLEVPEEKAARSGNNHRRILVVDDEDYILVLLEEVLTILGYQPLTAANAQKALDLLADHPVDLIITDMDMPGLSGVELLHRAKQINPKIPVILITGYGPERAARAAQEHGADGFLGKPFHIEELRFWITRLIET